MFVACCVCLLVFYIQNPTIYQQKASKTAPTTTPKAGPKTYLTMLKKNNYTNIYQTYKTTCLKTAPKASHFGGGSGSDFGGHSGGHSGV